MRDFRDFRWDLQIYAGLFNFGLLDICSFVVYPSTPSTILLQLPCYTCYTMQIVSDQTQASEVRPVKSRSRQKTAAGNAQIIKALRFVPFVLYGSNR